MKTPKIRKSWKINPVQRVHGKGKVRKGYKRDNWSVLMKFLKEFDV